MTAARVRELADASSTLFAHVRPAGVAVIGAVFGAEDPGAATRALLDALVRL
jgi:thiamine monophosphate synthase